MTSTDDDLYAAFMPPTEAPQWGASSNPYNVQATGGSFSSVSGPGNLKQDLPPSTQQRPSSQWNVGSSRGIPGSQWGAVSSSMKTGAGGIVGGRPMTRNNRGTGFNSRSKPKSDNAAVFDPTGKGIGAQMGPAPPLQSRGENSPEEKCNEMEREVNALIEESAVLALQGDPGAAFEKAKEAGKKERQLCKQCEQLNLSEQINVDLTYAVHFNLAVQYQNHQLFTEALNTYSLIVRNTQYPQAGRLRVNMGNIYAEQKKYLLAIKMYRIALEETSNAGKAFKLKIMRNIANIFVKMGQFKDAVMAYEPIMESGGADVVAGFNLILCYYALGDMQKLKQTFVRLLNIKCYDVNDEDNVDDSEKEKDVLVDDALHLEIRVRRQQRIQYIVTAARLIAPVLDADWRVGYDYVIEQLRQHDSRDTSSQLASELEMRKALNYLKHKKYQEAIAGLKAFEKKDKVLRARAATNLAYLYFLEKDFDSGEKYADMSIEFDCYNAKAVVNKANFLFTRGEYSNARNLYGDALAVEVDNVEALYNMGLTTKKLGLFDESLRLFTRLQTLVDSPEIIYQIADLHDLIGDGTSTEWFIRLISRVPTDPGVLARLGKLYAKERDESQAFHYYLEAYRYYQVNMDVIGWLGAYFVHNEIYDKAIQFFERASTIQPHEIKWQLMTASCYRRLGEYPQAKLIYEQVHRKNPHDLECLKLLITLCKDVGQSEDANFWTREYKKLEKKIPSIASGGNSGRRSSVESGLSKRGGLSSAGSGASYSTSPFFPSDGDSASQNEGSAGGAFGVKGGCGRARDRRLISDSARERLMVQQEKEVSEEKGQHAESDEEMELPGVY